MLRPADSKRAAAAEHNLPPRPERRRSKVGFKLDTEAGFYGFVFSYADGSCIADVTYSPSPNPNPNPNPNPEPNSNPDH